MTESKDDEVIEVRLPRKDYLVMREMIEERQAMTGLKKFLQTRVLWPVGAILSVMGLIEAFRRFSP